MFALVAVASSRDYLRSVSAIRMSPSAGTRPPSLKDTFSSASPKDCIERSMHSPNVRSPRIVASLVLLRQSATGRAESRIRDPMPSHSIQITILCRTTG
jgi:hypothetical protein